MSKIPQRKKRTEALYGTTMGDISELTVTVDQRTGEVTFGGAMTNVYSEISYERRKGPKVVSRVPQPQSGMNFSPQAALKKNFEFRCAVDTNTRIIQGKKVSVTGIVSMRPVTIPAPDGLKEYWKFDVPFCIETVGLKVAPERFGWIVAWERLCMKGLITQTTKVGMVVDSDLGNLKSFNESTLALFGDVKVPPNMVLVYASSDTGQEHPVNKALSVADSVSSQGLAAIENALVPFNVKTGESEWYDAMRIIYPNVVETGKV